jgi:hypothetical protein
MFTVTFQQLRKANPDERIPQFWGRPKHLPGTIYFYRAVALFFLMFSSYAWLDAWGYWALGLIFIAAIPAAVLNSRHNRRVQAAGGGSNDG